MSRILAGVAILALGYLLHTGLSGPQRTLHTTKPVPNIFALSSRKAGHGAVALAGRIGR